MTYTFTCRRTAHPVTDMYALSQILFLRLGHSVFGIEWILTLRTTAPEVHRKLVLCHRVLGRIGFHANFQIESQTPGTVEWSANSGPRSQHSTMWRRVAPCLPL